MAKQTITLPVTGTPISSSAFGIPVKNTIDELWKGTTAGDIDYYTSGTAKSRLAIGTAGQVLKVNPGATAPLWGSGGGINAIGMDSFAPGQTFSSDTWTDITGATLNLVTTTTCTVVVFAIATGYNVTTGNSFVIKSVIAGTADAADYDTLPFNGAETRNEALPYIYFASGVAAGTITVKLQCRKQGTNNVVERGRFIAIAFTE